MAVVRTGQLSHALIAVLMLVLSACAGEPAREAAGDATPEVTGAATGSTASEPAEATADPLSTNLTDGCVEDPVDGSVFVDQVTFEHATGVTVSYEDTYKVVEVSPPDIPDAEPLRYVLVQCGTTPPADLEGEVVEVPVDTVVTMTTTNLPHFDTLDAVDRLVGVGSGAFVSTESVLDAVAAGDIGEYADANGVPDLERLIATGPDLAIVDAFGDAVLEDVQRMSRGGVPTVINADFDEQTLLGRAEWLKFTALFLNAEAAANAAFDEVAATYAEVSATATGADERPTVFANTPFEGTWFMPAGDNSFATAIADAGGEYVFDHLEGTRNVELDIETVIAEAADADVWLQAGSVNGTLDDLLAQDERFAEFAAFQSGQVWAYDKLTSPGGGLAIFELAYTRPDVLLSDLVAILHPELLEEHETIFFGRVPE